ncbi:hypothetical protein LOH54_12295 [Sulfurimonas sp. HSL-3221]|uniref:hypothetical protein n=1 Tax=Sulfurimonadaceae TaxID=2771471 RepID=UPI001E5AFDF9|nr:hypothetical protein [Sulfurimonas sp. HSL-3221]UFS62414.1 hypothetical protein LOH54_12295 [Sulfurimonas sp. HSL-3221]
MTATLHRAVAGMILAVAPLSGDGLFAGIKAVNATLSYRVKDSALGLEARLRFPATAAVGELGYALELPAGVLRFSFASAFASQKRTGDDTDWKDGNRTVFSQSDTTLDGCYAFHADFLHPVSSNFAVGIDVFYEQWRLSWSHTRQIDYTDGTQTVLSGTTVRFTQHSGGVNLYGVFDATLFTLPWRFRGGISLARQYNRDDHLQRGFYTLSEGWMKGVLLGADAVLFRHAASMVKAGISYRRSEGDADMHYYYDYGPHYMTLPATFTTEVTEASLMYQYAF